MFDLRTTDAYVLDTKCVAEKDLPWEKLKGKNVVISGATGLLGSFLVDVLMYKNQHDQIDCNIIALGRSAEKAKSVFSSYWSLPNFFFEECVVDCDNFSLKCSNADYILHLASNTHPRAYATDPIGTITTNVMGTNNLLKLAVEKKARRFLFASSVEIYGENRQDCESFREEYCGYIDCNTLRAGYPESKRTGEALCQAYMHQAGLDVVIARLARSYGPTMLETDTKAISQFINNALKGENIVLKSAGTQMYSYTYMADAVAGVLYCLLLGEKGEAYNIADETSAIELRKLADIIAQTVDRQVVFALPDQVESVGFSKASKAILNGEKVRGLGWKVTHSIPEGVKRTIQILRSKYPD